MMIIGMTSFFSNSFRSKQGVVFTRFQTWSCAVTMPPWSMRFTVTWSSWSDFRRWIYFSIYNLSSSRVTQALLPHPSRLWEPSPSFHSSIMIPHDGIGVTVLYAALNILVQTFFYGKHVWVISSTVLTQLLKQVFTAFYYLFLPTSCCMPFGLHPQYHWILTDHPRKNKLKTRANVFMFTTTILMFIITTGYWIAGIAGFISIINSKLLESVPRTPDVYMPLFSALGLLNVRPIPSHVCHTGFGWAYSRY